MNENKNKYIHDEFIFIHHVYETYIPTQTIRPTGMEPTVFGIVTPNFKNFHSLKNG